MPVHVLLLHDRDDARRQDLVVEDDVARRLRDMQGVVVSVREHRRGKAARDATVPGVEIVDPIESLIWHPSGPSHLEERLGVRRERRQLTVLRADQKGCAPREIGVLDPVPEPLRSRLGRYAGLLGVIGRIRTAGVRQAFRMLLRREPEAIPIAARPLEQDLRLCGIVIGPGAGEIPVAPRRLLRGVGGRRRRQGLEIC